MQGTFLTGCGCATNKYIRPASCTQLVLYRECGLTVRKWLCWLRPYTQQLASSRGFPVFSAAVWHFRCVATEKVMQCFRCVAAKKAGKPGDKATLPQSVRSQLHSCTCGRFSVLWYHAIVVNSFIDEYCTARLWCPSVDWSSDSKKLSELLVSKVWMFFVWCHEMIMPDIFRINSVSLVTKEW